MDNQHCESSQLGLTVGYSAWFDGRCVGRSVLSRDALKYLFGVLTVGRGCDRRGNTAYPSEAYSCLRHKIVCQLPRSTHFGIPRGDLYIVTFLSLELVSLKQLKACSPLTSFFSRHPKTMLSSVCLSSLLSSFGICLLPSKSLQTKSLSTLGGQLAKLNRSKSTSPVD